MKKEIIVTADGSHTISIPEKNITYHSLHGAVQESWHVFIEAGLNHILAQNNTAENISIFEMGFGTGLNAFLTAIRAKELAITIHYAAIETFPLSIEEASFLNYPLEIGHKEWFERMHHSKWNEPVRIAPHFMLEKKEMSLLSLSTFQPFDLIYYDAFAPSAQPELWTKDVFEKLYATLKPNGFLVTYCSKGDVRRAMMAAGFSVEKIPGPKGKREMVRAKRS